MSFLLLLGMIGVVNIFDCEFCSAEKAFPIEFFIKFLLESFFSSLANSEKIIA